MPQRTTPYGFQFLFLTLVSLIVTPPYLEMLGVRGVSWAILAVVLLASLYLVANNRKQLFVGVVLAVPTLGLNLSREVLGHSETFYFSMVMSIVFLVYIEIFLLRFFLLKQRVTQDMIFAALCAYIIMGVIFSFIFICIESLVPGSFIISATGEPPVDLGKFSYFSFVTLTTLGYGDISPVNDFGRGWVTLEAILGQFYIAVVLARIVGLYTAAQTREADRVESGEREER